MSEPENRQPKASKSNTGKTGRAGAREAAAALLASGSTFRAAAESVGIGERTLRGWNDDDKEFQDRVKVLRAQMVAESLGRLSSTMSASADALKELVSHADPHVRYKAAKAILELSVKLKESVELEQRIAELEQRLGSEGRTHG